MLKFSNVEVLDNIVNNTLWCDEYNYLFLTIKRLKRLGCNVKELERAFNKHEKQLFKS